MSQPRGKTSKFASWSNSRKSAWCLHVYVWTRLDIAHIWPGCVSAAVTAHVSAEGLGGDVKVCVSALFFYLNREFSWILTCVSILKKCVCVCVCPILLFHTLCSLKPSLGLFSSIPLSFIFPPWDGKLLLSLVQLMLRAHATESPDTFLYISLWVWHGPWHRSDLRRLSDSSGSTVRASSSPLVTTLSLICCRKTRKKQQKKMTVCVWECVGRDCLRTSAVPSWLVLIGPQCSLISTSM